EQFPSVSQPGPQGGSWPAASYQLGPGHPSYPSYPSAEAFPSAGSWPSSPALPAEAPSWMSQDSAGDVWVASRGAPSGENRLPRRENGLPQRESSLPQRGAGALSDDTRPWTREPAPSASGDVTDGDPAATGPLPAVSSAQQGQ